MKLMKSDQFSYYETLRNGCLLFLRAIRPDDKQQLLDGFHRLKDKSVYLRFLGTKRELTEKELKYFTEIDFEHHVAIAATIIKNGKEEIIGVGRYIELMREDSERVAEIAFTVDDEHQNLGVGTILFKQIVKVAKKNGISILEADVLAENIKMLKVFKHSSCKYKMSTRSGVVHIELNLTDQE